MNNNTEGPSGSKTVFVEERVHSKMYGLSRKMFWLWHNLNSLNFNQSDDQESRTCRRSPRRSFKENDIHRWMRKDFNGITFKDFKVWTLLKSRNRAWAKSLFGHGQVAWSKWQRFFSLYIQKYLTNEITMWKKLT